MKFIQVSKDLENIPFTRVAYGEVKRCRLLKELKIIPINFFILFLAQFVTNALIYLVQWLVILIKVINEQDIVNNWVGLFIDCFDLTLPLRAGEMGENPLRSVTHILVSEIRIFICFTSFSH